MNKNMTKVKLEGGGGEQGGRGQIMLNALSGQEPSPVNMVVRQQDARQRPEGDIGGRQQRSSPPVYQLRTN